MARSRKSTSSRDYASAFGKALDEQLAQKSMRKSDLASALGVTPSYVSRLASGATNASPSMVNSVSTAMGLDQKAWSSLMQAAAEQKGYAPLETPCPHCGKKPSDPPKR